MKLDLNKQDFDAVTAAIGKAEKQTSVEFFAVLAERSDDYRFVAGFLSAVWLFLAGLIYVIIANLYWLDVSLLMYAGVQMAIFLAVNTFIRFRPGSAIKIVPKEIRFRRAHANAVQQFLAHGISNTSSRNGVLIFVSMAEHYAEILADSGIAEKTEQSFWDDAVAKLIAHAKSDEISKGYTETIDLLADQMAPIFPPTKKKSTGLDDRLVLLSPDQ